MIAVWLAACAAPPTPPAQPNVVLVSMDTVRWDHTSLAGGRDTTPNLARLAAVGESWSRAYAVANESLTSHAALFTGRYPSEVAVPDYGSFALPSSATTLAGALRANGYQTAAFTGGGHVTATFGFDNGFDTFWSAPGDTRFASFFDTVPRAAAWTEARTGPWMVFVHGYDAHSPYAPRGAFRHPWGDAGGTELVEALAADPLAVEQLRGSRWFPDRRPEDFVHAAGRTLLGTDFYRLPAEPAPGERVVELTPAEVAHLRDHYDAGVYYADVWLGLLLARVDLRDTLVVVVADHGEDLLDHGYMNHRAGLWDSTLHVPLVVAGPGFGGGVVHDGLVDLRQVLPTVLAAAGARVPAGVTAAPLGGPGADAVYAEGVMDAVRVDDGHGSLTLAGVGLARGAPDLGTAPLEALGAELRDAAGDAVVLDVHADRAGALRAALVAWRAGLPVAAEPGTPLGPEVREALRARGYWTPSP